MKSLKVLFLAAEADPLIKVGGLGDVSGSLPRALKELPETKSFGYQVDARLVLPFHSAIRKKLPNPLFLFEFDIQAKEAPLKASVYFSLVNNLPVYLIDGDPIGGDSPVYSPDAAADSEKYFFFSKAILPFLKKLGWKPDIIHANDWHTALAVNQLRIERETDSFYKHSKSIITIHNLPFMGSGTELAFDKYGFLPSRYSMVPWWGKKFPLVLGIQTADRITTVSKTYAEEILTPEFGCGLEKLIKVRKKVVSGIVNGLDEAAWNPADDTKIPANFDRHHLSKRYANKKALLEEFQLDSTKDYPLLVLVSRMDQQKGVDLAVEGLELVADRGWQAILLGTGNPQLEEACMNLEKKFPDKIRAAIRFDTALSRRMYAGGDVLLMPSRYEPCGLAQMMAMRYGCIPLARATGGLKDTIIDVVNYPEIGTGFLFAEATAGAFAACVNQALDHYGHKDAWKAMQGRGMAQDFSWEKSALEYLRLYLDMI